MGSWRDKDRRGHEAKQEDEKREQGSEPAARIKRCRIVDWEDTNEPQAEQQGAPEVPSFPEFEEGQSDQKEGKKDGIEFVQARTDRAENVATVQLRRGQQIERSGKETDPGGAPNRVKEKCSRGNAGLQPGGEKAKHQWRPENDFGVLRIGNTGNDAGVQDAVCQGWNGEDETNERAGSADVEQGARRSNRRANENEGAKRSDERGKGNEERVAGANVMVAASEEMTEFVSKQNRKQREGKRETGGEACGIFVEEGKSTEEFVKRSRIVLSVGRCELRAGHEAGAKGQKKKHAR